MAQYLKQDSELGYIEDNAEIEYSKFNNLRHVILGCMLGDFDETGAYVVQEDLIKELIAMPKHIIDTYDNIEICRGELRLDKYISFMVAFEGNKATLSLIEKLNYEANFKLNSGAYSNIIETVLDEVETSGEINRNTLYQRWNISAFADGDVIDVFNCDPSALEKYFGIVNRFKYLLETNKILLEKEEELEEIEAGYSNEILDILKHYPALEASVKKQIKENLAVKKNSLNLNKPNFAKTFNEVLDNAIQNNLDVLNDKEKEEFNIEKRNAVVNSNIKKQEVLDVVKETTDNENGVNPPLTKLNVNPNIYNSTVVALGEGLVSANSEVNLRLGSTAKTKKDSEKNKLTTTIIGAGLGAVVAGATGAVVGAVVGGMVADIVDAAKKAESNAAPKKENAPANKTTANNKNNSNKKDSNNKKAPAKPADKKPAAKKSVAVKPVSNTQGSPTSATTQTLTKPNNTTQITKKRRRYSSSSVEGGLVAGAVERNQQGQGQENNNQAQTQGETRKAIIIDGKIQVVAETDVRVGKDRQVKGKNKEGELGQGDAEIKGNEIEATVNTATPT